MSKSTASLEAIASWGVVGAGGAGFPTHVKLKAKADTVILNGAECEPLLHKDKEVMRAYADEIIAGLRIAGEHVGATEAVIGIKGKYHDVIEVLRPKLPRGMRIAELTDSYPTGDEFILVYDVTKRIIPPGKIPLAVGCVVLNVETAFNIARGEPVTKKFLTVAGAVNDPVTICVPLGTTFRQAIELAGGANVQDPAVLVGGVMMGRLATSLEEPITKTTGGLIVLPQDHSLIRRYSRSWDHIARIGVAGCDQCNFCTDFCPRYLLGHPIEPAKAMRSLGFNMAGESTIIGTQFCCECNLCTMIACPEDLDPKNVCTQNKRRLAKEGKRWDVQANPDRARLHLDNRRVPIGRLIRKLGLFPYKNKGPLVERTAPLTRVALPLKQHAGAPARATVAPGARVNIGDVIGRPAEGQLGSTIHASVTGRVVDVGEAVIIES